MEDIRLITLAEKYCEIYHRGQKRKGGNQEPYQTHPFAVRDILKEYGHNSVVQQCVTLMHDLGEDTEIKIKKLRKVFGFEIAHGIYVVSNNKVTEDEIIFAQNNFTLPENILTNRDKLIKKILQFRLIGADEVPQLTKLGDTTHNTKSLTDYKKNDSIERKLVDSLEVMIPIIGYRRDKVMTEELAYNVKTYMNSTHFADNFPNGISITLNEKYLPGLEHYGIMINDSRINFQ